MKNIAHKISRFQIIHFMNLKNTNSSKLTLYICPTVWPSPLMQLIYTFGMTLMMTVLPVVIITKFYDKLYETVNCFRAKSFGADISRKTAVKKTLKSLKRKSMAFVTFKTDETTEIPGNAETINKLTSPAELQVKMMKAMLKIVSFFVITRIPMTACILFVYIQQILFSTNVTNTLTYRLVFLKMSYSESFEVIFGSKNVILSRFRVKTCNFRSFWSKMSISILFSHF